jgi:hypothetical protein
MFDIFTANRRFKLMAKVELAAPRSIIEQTADSLRITIPARKDRFRWFLLCWLLAWACGEFGALFYLPELLVMPVINAPQESFHAFLYTWLAFWTLFGTLTIYSLLWWATGKDIVVITPSRLQYIKSVAGMERSKEYGLSAIKNLRTFAPRLGKRSPYDDWGLLTIVFDDGKRIRKFGDLLDEAEANYIVDTIKQRLKTL